MAGNISEYTTNLTNLSVAGSLSVTSALIANSFGLTSDLSLAGGTVSITSIGRETLASGTSLVVASGATVTFSPGAMWSVGTISTAASLASVAGAGMQIGFFFAASGCSIIGRSGNTIYTFGTSAVSAAAP